jgi:hypothetical protein
LVDPVDDEDVEEIRVLRLLVLQRLTMRSKENGRILTLIRSIDHHFLLTLHWLGNIFNVITDLTPFGDWTYRRPAN